MPKLSLSTTLARQRAQHCLAAVKKGHARTAKQLRRVSGALDASLQALDSTLYADGVVLADSQRIAFARATHELLRVLAHVDAAIVTAERASESA
jgi:hypothetical protein